MIGLTILSIGIGAMAVIALFVLTELIKELQKGLRDTGTLLVVGASILFTIFMATGLILTFKGI